MAEEAERDGVRSLEREDKKIKQKRETETERERERERERSHSLCCRDLR